MNMNMNMYIRMGIRMWRIRWMEECLCGLGKRDGGREEGSNEGRKEKGGRGRDLNDLLCCHTKLINSILHFT